MPSIIKESFKITNKYIVLATPLILFSLISTIYLALSAGGKYIGLIIAIIAFFLMLCAFLAGWFGMLSICIKNPAEEEPNDLIKHFVSGVGEYFLPVMGMIIISFFVGIVLFTASTILGNKFIGNPNIPVAALQAALVSVESMKAFLLSLSTEQLIKINLWNLLLFFVGALSYFIIIFYPAALFFKTKNPLKAFLYSQKDLFTRHFFKNLALFLFIFVTYFVLSIFSTLGSTNMVLHFIFTLINFYFIVYACVLIFNYYYSNFIKIGSRVDEIV